MILGDQSRGMLGQEGATESWVTSGVRELISVSYGAILKPILDHVAAVVRPALRNYLADERALTDAIVSNDHEAACTARQDVMLAARQAVDVLHHLSDFVLKEPSASAAMGAFEHIEDVRSAVEAKGVFLRTAKPVPDVRLLRALADAFTHPPPARPSAMVLVSSDVVSISIGWDQARWDEGKWDSPEQVIIITTKDGDKRALWSVLQNVFDAWITLLGEPLPPISQY